MTNAEIQVGEYVRTKSGNIGKVLYITNVTMQKRKKYLVKWNISKAYYITLNIVKHSPNIIDLIEVGDYVNGMQVVEKYENSFAFEYEGQLFGNKQIKTIVTKEQFKSMEYKAGGEDEYWSIKI